ncbi:MAG: Ribosomal RNA small subunit methyltransferase E [uncultured Rubrobacteraceae bacterium]|uniref:Ribosomal RNA small subunit methyltransferase E n=1 Tax=uncultured Rubrobacteraceae bacterium TaxID=349277 RepID=A0A6J4PII4_9ACTN|nr:MAG: Ribosomal RNA small subunit methyltransferase E [uncultured Rubrobacteraceae bacterium]
MRARPGDLVEVVGAGGGLFLGHVGEGRSVTVVEELEAGFEELAVTLYQAVPKGGRMDLVVEKATEAGATGIVPLLTEHGEVNPRENKLDRWRRVAEAAARQSLRLRVPEVREPETFGAAIREAGEAGLLLHNAAGAGAVEDAVEDAVGAGVSLFVGPEGGWSAGELEGAREAGLSVAGLGPYRLRSETAGIVAVARARAALERLVRVEGGV